MHDGTTLTFRTPETIPNGLPAHEPRLVRATAESLADYGTIVTDPDNHKVEIVPGGRVRFYTDATRQWTMPICWAGRAIPRKHPRR